MDNDKRKHMGNNNTPKRSKNRIFGIWPKRSTKVEPQPITTESIINNLTTKNDDDKQNKKESTSTISVAFAKCSPVKRFKRHNNENNEYQQQQKQQSSQKKIINLKNNNNNDKSSCSYNYNNNDNVKLRSRPSNQKKRNTISFNNNRFSHQFHLCCSIDQKSQTPPVSVRYNSLPESVNFNQQHHQNDPDILLNSTSTVAPLAEIECCSAPESPVSKNSHSSPSTTSVQSTQSDQPRSIAITACKSRLRLKLLPPGKTIATDKIKTIENVITTHTNRKNNADGSSITKQHFSSPNIFNSSSSSSIKKTTEREKSSSVDGQQNVRSMSHDGIQSIHRNSITSADSLAKQALMAAQMLSLIPTEKARERNYMAGKLAVNPLLGANELVRVLPTKEVKIFVGTWNMNGQSPEKQMNDFILPTGIEHVPDIVAIGTQESCSERFEWEVTLQETLGPSHILFHSAYLGTLHLAIFIRRDLVWFCSVPEEASMSVRPGTAFRTKGAVAISFALFGTSMLFVTSHLTAHQQKVKERVQDVKRITHALDLPKNLKLRHKSKDVTQNFDIVYWCGDLNFRLSEPREKLLDWIQNTKFPLPAHLPHGYMHTDQLSSVLADGAAFKGFMEANIRFPPTYKYDPGTQHFDTSSKQRAPAYTDRILYKYRTSYLALRRSSHIAGPFHPQQPPPVECLAYDSVPSITTSDHKPVWALFRTIVRPGIDTIPLAAGLFNREVYLEGMRRRLNSTGNGSSAVCSIQ